MTAAASRGHTPFITAVTGLPQPTPDGLPMPHRPARNSRSLPAAAVHTPAMRRDRHHDAAFRQAVVIAVLVAVAAVAAPLRAATPDARPVRDRPLGTPQGIGVLHTLRQIPEACARLEGVFLGDAARPYRMRAVAVAPGCQPRARYRPAHQATPSAATGWILEDRIRVPSAACPSQLAVVQVWRKPGAAAPARDGQGQARIYLEDAQRQAAAGLAPGLPEYSAEMEVVGEPCAPPTPGPPRPPPSAS